MWFFNDLVTFFNNMSSRFYDTYYEMWYWTPPFNAAAGFFYTLSTVSSNIAWAMSDLGTWANGIVSQIAAFLSWTEIRAQINSWLYGIESAIAWFWDRWNWFINQVNSWWSSTMVEVQGWIDIARAELQDLIDGLEVLIDDFLVIWDSFKAKIPTLDEVAAWFSDRYNDLLAWFRSWGILSGLEIGDLIDSILRTWFPFYDELVSLWSDIRDFFADPQQYVYDKLDEWFERFW